MKNGELHRRFPLCFRPRRRSVGAPSARARSARASPLCSLRDSAAAAVCRRAQRTVQNGTRPTLVFPPRHCSPHLWGRGALGVGVLFFLLYYFLLSWFYSTLMVLSSFVQAYKGQWRFAQRRSTAFTRCDFTLGVRLAPRLSRRCRGGCAGSARAPVRAGRRCRDGCRFRWCRCPHGRA